MKKNTLLMSMLSISLFFTSCNKDEEVFQAADSTESEDKKSGGSIDAYTANQRLTDGTSKKWKWVKHEQNNKGIAIPACDLSNTFEFFADGNRTIKVADTLCNKHVVTPQQVYSSRWSFFGDDSIKFESAGSTAAYRIKDLTPERFSLETQVDISDTLGNVTNTIKLVETFAVEAPSKK
jgi:hypothetical protein